jgi:hypothetical protein
MTETAFPWGRLMAGQLVPKVQAAPSYLFH